MLSNLLLLVTGLASSVIFDKVIPNQGFVTLWAVAGACGMALLFDLAARQLAPLLVQHDWLLTQGILQHSIRHPLVIGIGHNKIRQHHTCGTIGQSVNNLPFS